MLCSIARASLKMSFLPPAVSILVSCSPVVAPLQFDPMCWHVGFSSLSATAGQTGLRRGPV